jgi:hypothetical protein
MAATISINTTLTCETTGLALLPSGDFQIGISMIDSSGNVRRQRMLTVKADGSAVVDESGNAIATPASELVTNMGTLRSSIDATLSSAISAGKITF